MASSTMIPTRRLFLAGSVATVAIAAFGARFGDAFTQAQAAGALEPTETMRGGSNNYVPNAPLVDNLGTGFVVSGSVMRSDNGAPASGLRIQIWAATERGGEREPSNRGSVLTDASGRYTLEMSQIVPQFGQPHIHMAYDDGAFETLFLRPVLKSRDETALTIDIVLAPAAGTAPQQS